MVVGTPWEQDVTGKELVNDAADAPHVHWVIIREPQDDFGCAVKPRHQVRRDAVAA